MKLKITECGKNEYIASLNGKIMYNITRSDYKWIASKKKTGEFVDQDQYRYDLFERLTMLWS